MKASMFEKVAAKVFNRSVTTKLFVVAVLGMLALPYSARAALLFQDGFETPVQGDAGYSGLSNAPDGWALVGGAGAQYFGVLNPNDASYLTGSDDTNPITLGTVANMDGHNIVFDFFGSGGATLYTKTLPDTLDYNTPYLLTVSVGSDKSYPISHGYQLQLLVDLGGGLTQLLASVSNDGAAIPSDALTPVSLSYRSTTSDPIGLPLIIRFGTRTIPSGVTETETTFFDALSLQTVPEPASLSLLALGGAMLLSRRRK